MQLSEQHEAAVKTLLEDHKDKLPPWCGYNTENLEELPVGPGWAVIILALCKYIDWIAYTYGVKTKVAQVKEKFGGLRFYTNGYDIDPEYLRLESDGMGGGNYTRIKNQGSILTKPEENFNVDAVIGKVQGAISLAESLCDKTCERCGVVGKARGGGMIGTLCDECYAPIAEEDAKAAAEYEADMKEAHSADSNSQ